jgi:hypothetical protein
MVEVPNQPNHFKKELTSYLEIKLVTKPDTFKQRVNRFFLQITNIFAKQNSEYDPNLMGRISELESFGQQTLDALSSLKERIEKEGDTHLISGAAILIDPLYRETKRLSIMMEGKHTAAHQVKLYNRYVNSLDKAQLLISSLGNAASEAEIRAYVQQQLIEAFHAKIDRDLQLIRDYLDHALAHPKLTEPERQKINENIHEGLAEQLNSLQSLKESAQELRLETMISWRSKVDDSREKWFGEALHIIDMHIKSLSLLSKDDFEQY